MAYIALIKHSAVRDAQYALVPDADPMDDGAWTDASEAEIYLGIRTDESRDAAVAWAAEYAGTAPENIRLVEI